MPKLNYRDRSVTPTEAIDNGYHLYPVPTRHVQRGLRKPRLRGNQLSTVRVSNPRLNPPVTRPYHTRFGKGLHLLRAEELGFDALAVSALFDARILSVSKVQVEVVTTDTWARS